MAEGEADKSVDVSALQSRLAELEAQKKTWMGKATDYEKRFKGVDPDDYHATKQALEDLNKQKALGDPKQMEAWKTETEKSIRASIQKELDTFIGENKQLKGTVRELQVVDRVFKEIAGGFNDDCFDDIKSYIRKYCDLNEQGEIVVKDDQGNVRYAPGSTSKPMGPVDFGSWLGDQKKSWRKPSHVSGTEGAGSARSANSNGHSVSLRDIASLPSSEQRKVLATLSPEQRAEISKQLSGSLFGV